MACIEMGLAHARGSDGSRLLHAACRLGLSSLAALLREAAPAEGDALDDQLQSPLHLACASGHTACVQLLLEARCDARLRGRMAATPLMMAATRGHCDIVRPHESLRPTAGGAPRLLAPPPLPWSAPLSHPPPPSPRCACSSMPARLRRRSTTTA